MECRKQTGRRRRVRRRETGIGAISFAMVTRLLKEIEQIFSGNEFKEEEKVRRSFKGLVKRDNIGMRGKRLVDGHLGYKVRTEKMEEKGTLLQIVGRLKPPRRGSL
jgi:hypothetical protein